MKIIDGRAHAQTIRNEIKTEIKKTGRTPGLAVVLVGSNPASEVYVRHKKKACAEVGIQSFNFTLPENTNETELLGLINDLNLNEQIHGILVQLPLPKHLNEQRIIQSIDPKKDVDCFHPENVGKLYLGQTGILPCTPAGIIELLKRSGIEISGKNCVVLGRSNIVGKPVAQLLLQENGTVTVCHSKTKNLEAITKTADILVAAIGQAGFVKKEMVKPGATVIDVGINRLDNGQLAGDVDFDSVKTVAGKITPVPGGVGPMTIAMLLKNCLKASK